MIVEGKPWPKPISTDPCSDGAKRAAGAGLSGDEADARLLLRALARRRLQGFATNPYEETLREDCGLGDEAFALAVALAERHGWIDKDDEGQIAANRSGRLAGRVAGASSRLLSDRRCGGAESRGPLAPTSLLRRWRRT